MAEKKIKGNTYKVDAVLATEAIRLQMRLLKVIGGGIDRLPTILSGVGKTVSEEKKAESNAAAVAAFTDIFMKGDPDEMTMLIKDVVELARIKRPSGSYEQVDLDGDFTQDKSALIPLVVFILREVFGDFFSDALENGSLSKVMQG